MVIVAGMTTFVAVGDVMLDLFVERRAGSHESSIRAQPGGSAANSAVWAAAASAAASVVGRVGRDLAGDAIAAALERRGVVPLLGRDDAASSGAVAYLLESGRRSIVASRGATGRFAPSDVPAALRADAVLVSGHVLFHDDSRAGAEAALARASAAWVGVDVPGAPPVALDELVQRTRRANALFADEETARALTGQEPDGAVRALSRHFSLVCVTSATGGAAGALSGATEAVPVPFVVEEPGAGAGDAFAATVLVWLSRGSALTEALTAGCSAGSAAAASIDGWPPLER